MAGEGDRANAVDTEALALRLRRHALRMARSGKS